MLSAYLAAAAQLFDPNVRASLWRALFVALAAMAALWTGAGFALPWLALLVSAGVAFFLDDVADAVERRHYPGLASARAQSAGEMAGIAARFLALVVLVNLILVPFLFVPPVFPFVFYPANGYLLGREYFELVAARRANPELARALSRRNRLSLWAAGTVAALMLTVPLLNLVAPVIATAAMVHLFHAWRGEAEQARENE